VIERTNAGRDSSLSRLLRDLDLVLIAIAQYAADPQRASEEATLIEDAIRARQLSRQLSRVLGRNGTDASGG
jgi:hypothetical protein